MDKGKVAGSRDGQHGHSGSAGCSGPQLLSTLSSFIRNLPFFFFDNLRATLGNDPNLGLAAK